MILAILGQHPSHVQDVSWQLLGYMKVVLMANTIFSFIKNCQIQMKSPKLYRIIYLIFLYYAIIEYIPKRGKQVI